MKPYAQRQLTKEQRVFNYRLSRGRRIVENAFGILGQRWQIRITTMQHDTETIAIIEGFGLLQWLVQGLPGTDEALQEDGLFVWDLPLRDMGGSSTACPCSQNGDGLRESVVCSVVSLL